MLLRIQYLIQKKIKRSFIKNANEWYNTSNKSSKKLLKDVRVNCIVLKKEWKV